MKSELIKIEVAAGSLPADRFAWENHLTQVAFWIANAPKVEQNKINLVPIELLRVKPEQSTEGRRIK